MLSLEEQQLLSPANIGAAVAFAIAVTTGVLGTIATKRGRGTVSQHTRDIFDLQRRVKECEDDRKNKIADVTNLSKQLFDVMLDNVEMRKRERK